MMRRVHWAFLASALTALPLMACSSSDKAAMDARAAAQAQTNPTLSTTDATFLNEAAASGAAEVQFSQLAATKASSPAVRKFAQKMVSDHTQVNSQLMQLAQSKQLTPTTSLDSAHQASYDSLQNLKGRAFDRAYLQGQVSDHQTAIAAFQNEAQNGTDPDVKAFAASTVGALQKHLAMLQSMMGGSHAAPKHTRHH